jgi:hypothetical protein
MPAKEMGPILCEVSVLHECLVVSQLYTSQLPKKGFFVHLPVYTDRRIAGDKLPWHIISTQ